MKICYLSAQQNANEHVRNHFFGRRPPAQIRPTGHQYALKQGWPCTTAAPPTTNKCCCFFLFHAGENDLPWATRTGAALKILEAVPGAVQRPRLRNSAAEDVAPPKVYPNRSPVKAWLCSLIFYLFASFFCFNRCHPPTKTPTKAHTSAEHSPPPRTPPTPDGDQPCPHIP